MVSHELTRRGVIMDKINMTVKKFHQALVDKKITVQELIAFYLDRIEAYDHTLNSIICVNEKALEEAEELDNYYSENGFKGPLHGVPILLKDNVETFDMYTTAGSKSLEGYLASEDAFVVKKMKEAGAIIIAKTNLHEFAIWGETISSILGQSYNPYDLTRTPGGSSGGTGASVAAEFGLIGIGTDTINSVRSPSSANNLVGIRPTIGLVSKSGVVPYSKTQDALGPIARTVEDAAILLDVLKGFDPDEPKTKEGLVVSELQISLKEDGLKGKRVGILNNFFGKLSEHESTNQAVANAIEHMSDFGCHIQVVGEDMDSNYLVNDVSVHLYDLKDHLNEYLSALPETAPVHSVSEIVESGKYHPGIEENLKKAMLLSTQSDAYKERLKLRKKVQKNLLNLMDKYNIDALVYPHQKQLVCKIGGSQKERNGVLASVTGFPSICLPVGFSEATEDAPIGVPIGMEILGRPFDEGKLIEIAYSLEQRLNIRRQPILD
jgi:Asp-tRNA(Asn)/Glu-tRNA(Gln) amidotransferase A subunit family amidase